MSDWFRMPIDNPVNGQLIWVRLLNDYTYPFLATFDSSTQSFLAFSTNLVFPWYVVSRWKSLSESELSAISKDNLISVYELDSDGSALIDSFNSYNGSFGFSPTFEQPGKCLYSVLFSGAGDRADLSAVISNFLTDYISVSFWFKTSSSASQYFYRIGYNGHYMRINAGVVYAGVKHSTESSFMTLDSGSDTFDDGDWHFVTYNVGSTLQELYIDNVLIDSNLSDPGVVEYSTDATWSFVFACLNTLGSYYFFGNLDQMVFRSYPTPSVVVSYLFADGDGIHFNDW